MAIRYMTVNCARRLPVRHQTSQLPPRPDATVLSASIPLVFIGRDHNGFWVVQEAEGLRGGLFLLKRSALRFAREKRGRPGVATMLVTQPLELDVENQGSRVVTPLSAAMDGVSHRVPALAAFVAMAVAEWRTLVAQISCVFTGGRGR
jgi:hypothetical protein